MKKYQTVLFDLDGTLLNTLDDLHHSVNHALSAYSLPERTLAQTRADVGNGVKNLMIRSIARGEDHPDFEAILDLFRTHYAENNLIKTAPYEGVLSLLEELKKNGVKIGVVSNKYDAAVKQICAHFFPGLVDVALGERESEGIRKKPAPDAVLEAMRLLGADPASTVYVGDSEVDVETAKNASLPCILVTWGFRDEAALKRAGGEIFARDASQLSALL